MKWSGHELFRIGSWFFIKVLGYTSGGRFSHDSDISNISNMFFIVLVIPEMTKIELFENILHGIEFMGILMNDIGLSLFDIVSDSVDMERIDIAINQPH